ncbi:hypothetical protein [Coralloluteibacterium thermophilus]|uniref:Secreted protein n=1 Tax=Coralloluteibacterium thermophilum TaxID=2707049 RepID=A0ABV9NHM8_9GAMM
MIRFHPLALSFALALLAAGASAADDTPLRETLGAEEFHAMGLHKLDGEELARLEAWLARRDATATEATAQHAPPSDFGRRQSAPAREEQTLRMVGTFRGWRGEGDIFEFENGQRWQVRNTPAYVAPRASHAPTVTISPGSLGSWLMRVEGHPIRARVNRVD